MALASISRFLPLQQIPDSCNLAWAKGVVRVLMAISSGPKISRINTGEALFDSILDMRQETGMQDYAMPLNASHGLTLFFGQLLPVASSEDFFQSTLPTMANLALNFPVLLEKHLEDCKNLLRMDEFQEELHLRILFKQQPGVVLISQELVASIVACAFFCLFPSAQRSEAKLPGINFDKFFACIYDREKSEKQEHKMFCILHYFERIHQRMPTGLVSYRRKVISFEAIGFPVPDGSFWSTSKTRLCHLLVMNEGTIEDLEMEALQVDFANKYLGGGALRSGCVQEEIRFMINPELIAGILFLPEMDDNEALEICGVERYSNYKGYGSSFCYDGNHNDSRPYDDWGRRRTQIIAIDALSHPGEQQYEPQLILREVNKAFCGFLDMNAMASRELIGIATGNWGCGAFGGDVEVKSMIQWLSASQAERPFVLYYSFGLPRAERLQEIVNWISNEGWCVSDLWDMLLQYAKKRSSVTEGFFDWLVPKA